MVSVSVFPKSGYHRVRTTAYTTDARRGLVPFLLLFLRPTGTMGSFEMMIEFGFAGVFEAALAIEGNVGRVSEHVLFKNKFVHRPFGAQMASVNLRREMHSPHVGTHTRLGFRFELAMLARVLFLVTMTTVHVGF